MPGCQCIISLDIHEFISISFILFLITLLVLIKGHEPSRWEKLEATEEKLGTYSILLFLVKVYLISDCFSLYIQ